MKINLKINDWITSLDERAKIAAAFFIGIAAFACIQWESEVVLLGISLLLCVSCHTTIGVLIFVAVLGVLTGAIFLYQWITGNDTLSGMGIMFMILKFGPFCAMMVFLYKTVNTALFLKAMARMKVPAMILVPLGVTFRFMPSFIREFSHIRDALAFRGMVLTSKTVLKQPFKVMESVLIPLLMRSILIGEELSRAALARGIDAPNRPSSIHDIRFRRKDTLWSGLWAAGICLILYLDRSKGGI